MDSLSPLKIRFFWQDRFLGEAGIGKNWRDVNARLKSSMKLKGFDKYNRYQILKEDGIIYDTGKWQE